MQEKYWYLKNCSLFTKVDQDDITRLENASRTSRFPRKSQIYVPSDAGDSVLLVGSGRVRIYHITAEGKQAVTAFIDPGEMFGEMALFTGGERDEFAEAMEPSHIILISRSTIEDLMERHPEFSLAVTKFMGLRRKKLERRLRSLLFRSNRDRLIHLLLELAEKYGEQTPDGVLIGLRLSHQEMANVIGATRETVTVLLGELQYERLISIKRRRVYLKRMVDLAAAVDFPVPVIPPLPSSAQPTRAFGTPG